MQVVNKRTNPAKIETDTRLSERPDRRMKWRRKDVDVVIVDVDVDVVVEDEKKKGSPRNLSSLVCCCSCCCQETEEEKKGSEISVFWKGLNLEAP